MSLRANTPLPNVLRAEIERVRLALPVANPAGERRSWSTRDRCGTEPTTSSHHLFATAGSSTTSPSATPVEIVTPLDTLEKRNPREVDVRRLPIGCWRTSTSTSSTTTARSG